MFTLFILLCLHSVTFFLVPCNLHSLPSGGNHFTLLCSHSSHCYTFTRQSYNSWLWTPGLPDSRTPGLPDSRTPGLPKSRTPGLPDFWTPLKWKVVLLRCSSYFPDEIFGQYEWQSWALETWERTTTLLMWLWPVRMVSRWKLTRRSWLGRCLLINYITGIITSTPPTSTPTTSTSTTGALSLMRVQNSWISSNHSWMWSWGIPHNILTLIMRFRVPPILVQLQGSPNWPNYDRKWSLEKIWIGSIRLEGLMVRDRIKSKLGLVHCSPNLVHFIKTSAWTSCNPLRVFFAVPIAFGPPEQYFFMIFVDTRWQNISLWFCPWLFPLWFYPRRAIMETLYLHVNYMCLIYKWQIPFVAMKLLFVSCI